MVLTIQANKRDYHFLDDYFLPFIVMTAREVVLEGEVVSYNKEIEIEKRCARDQNVENVFVNAKIVEKRVLNQDGIAANIPERGAKEYIYENKVVDTRYLNEKKINPLTLYNLESLDVIITFDTEIFTLLKSHFEVDSFQNLREEKDLCIEFNEFPAEIANLLDQSQKKQVQARSPKKASHDDDDETESVVIFSSEGDGIAGSMIFQDILALKRVETFRLDFVQASEEESHVQAQIKFTAIKNELKLQTEMNKVLNQEIRQKCPFILEVIKK